MEKLIKRPATDSDQELEKLYLLINCPNFHKIFTVVLENFSAITELT